MSPSTDRCIVLTGGTGGIGLQSATGLAKTAARIIITGRNAQRGEAAAQRIRSDCDNPEVTFVKGDLSSLAAIDQLAAEVRKRADTIDVLVNNAGYLGEAYAESDDGLELHFAVNVLAPWRLTRALLPALARAPSARVINVTGGDKPAPVDPDNLQAEKGFKGLMTYTHSKSVMEAMSMFLAAELEPKNVSVNVVFPGRASTAMTRSLSPASLPGLMKLMYPFFRLFFRNDGGKSAEKAARSTIWAATSPELEGMTGAYFDTNSTLHKLHPSAYDPEVQRRIRSLIDATEDSSRGDAA